MSIEIAVWENEPVVEAEVEAKPPKVPPKTFTQEDVDRIVVNRNKAAKQQLEQVETRFESLLKEKTLSEEAKQELEADLENVRKQMRTKEEQLTHERKQAEQKYQKELELSRNEATRYKSLYENSTIDRELMDAAVAGEAYNPNQFVALLKGKTKLVKELDAGGNETSRMVPMIEWEIESEGKKEIALKSPAEVIKSMRENTETHGNLFRPNVVSGLGAGNAGPGKQGGKVNVKNMTPEEFMKFRDTPDGARALGLKR